MKVFLGGTCNNSTWREVLKPLLEIQAFDPVVPVWNEEAQKQELKERAECDLVLYVLTPLMTGFYSVAEVTDDSNKRPQRVLFCTILKDGELTFTPVQEKSFRALRQLLIRNNIPVSMVINDFTELNQLADAINLAAKHVMPNAVEPPKEN